MPIIASKFAEILNVQAANVWMVGGDQNLVLSHSSGFDPALQQGSVQRTGEGIASEVSDSGEALLIDSPEDQDCRGEMRESRAGRHFR